MHVGAFALFPMKIAVQRGAPLPVKIRVRLAASVAERGECRVAVDCGCSRQTLARALAGLPIYPGTVALIERYLMAREIR